MNSMVSHPHLPASVVAAAQPAAVMVWLPALGVPARKYQRFAEALAAHGVSCALHEWRGTGESPLVASRRCDWGYRELLEADIPATIKAVRERYPGVPLMVGGHSLGGQLATLSAALDGGVDAVVAVAAGVPDWRLYPAPRRWLVAGFGRVLPALTTALGRYPGHRLGFAGREAGQLMRDWASTVRHGHYDAVHGVGRGMGDRLRTLDLPMFGLLFNEDWLAPEAPLAALLAAAGGERKTRVMVDAAALGAPADHFSWMRRPQRVADAIGDWWGALRA